MDEPPLLCSKNSNDNVRRVVPSNRYLYWVELGRRAVEGAFCARTVHSPFPGRRVNLLVDATIFNKERVY